MDDMMNHAAEESLPPADPHWLASPHARVAEFTPTRDDLVEALVSASSGGKGRAAFQVIFWILALFASCAVIVTSFFLPPPADAVPGEATAYFVKTSVLLVFAVFAVATFARRKVLGVRRSCETEVDKMLRNPTTRSNLLASVRVIAAPHGCLVQTSRCSHMPTWASVQRVESTDNYCMVFAEPQTVLAAVPRSAFDSDQSFRDFVDACLRFKESAGQPNTGAADGPAGLDAAYTADPTNYANAPGLGSRRSALTIEPASEPPRPLYTPAERIGLYLATRGVLFAIVILVVGPVAYFEAARKFGWLPLPRQYWLAAWAVLGGALVLAVLQDHLYPGLPYRLFIRWRTARTLAARPDRIVSPGQPGAYFVQLVPRDNWQRAMPETATDQGWLAVDSANGRILFEGVRQRWIIPASCLESCRPIEVETRKVTVYVLLVVRDADRHAELPLLAFNFSEAKNRLRERRQAAAALATALTSLRDRT